jgi:cytochrome c oxidase subunit 3
MFSAQPSLVTPPYRPRAPEGHFASMEQQAHAARLGMWIFLSSELLLFAGMFALFITEQSMHPQGFHEGVLHNTKVLGSINTGVLLVSSTIAASAVHMVRAGRMRLAGGLVALVILFGCAFLAIKFTEYGKHFSDGIYPGGQGRFFLEHTTPGLPLFWSLYFLMTAVHALHVTIGMGVLGSTFFGMRGGEITPDAPQRMELAAIYWHLVDVIWIFLWPLFYLA